MDKDIKKYLSAGSRNLYLIYFCFLLGAIIPPMPLIGAIFAFANLEEGQSIWRTHYHFALRTFVITCIGIIISLVLAFIHVGLAIAVYLPICVWYLVRCITPLKLIMNNKAHPSPNSLWIA